MLIIRLSRVGRRNNAQYKLVLAEKTSPIQGRFVELLGHYNPHSKDFGAKEERVKYWIGKGAGCSDSAFNLLVSKGIIEGEKRKVRVPAKVKEEVVAEEAPAQETAAEATPAVEEKPAA